MGRNRLQIARLMTAANGWHISTHKRACERCEAPRPRFAAPVMEPYRACLSALVVEHFLLILFFAILLFRTVSSWKCLDAN